MLVSTNHNKNGRIQESPMFEIEMIHKKLLVLSTHAAFQFHEMISFFFLHFLFPLLLPFLFITQHFEAVVGLLHWNTVVRKCVSCRCLTACLYAMAFLFFFSFSFLLLHTVYPFRSFHWILTLFSLSLSLFRVKSTHTFVSSVHTDTHTHNQRYRNTKIQALFFYGVWKV